MKNPFQSKDKIKERKVKMPIDFDASLEYKSTNNMDVGTPKMKTKVIKKRSVGIKRKNKDKNSLF